MSTASTSVRLRVLPAISTLVAKRASAESGGAVAPDHWTEGPHYAEVRELLAAGFAPDALLLTPGDARQAASWLESLRRAPRLALLPIFLNRSFGEAVDALSDGVASTPEAAAPEAAAIAARAASLSRRETAEGDERLLAFLYLRPERVLTPVADWRDERSYRYPLADALGRFGACSLLMLELVRRRGSLDPAGLLERARTGQVGDLFKLLDEFSHARPEYFNHTLAWLIDLSRRHDEVQFGLVCLKFANVHLLASKLPRHRLAQMFDALAQRLRELIRTTDLFMRDDDEYCWLLLPQTPAGGVAILLERIAVLGAAAAPEEGLRIDLATASFTSADAGAGSTDARLIMGTLRSRVS